MRQSQLWVRAPRRAGLPETGRKEMGHSLLTALLIGVLVPFGPARA